MTKNKEQHFIPAFYLYNFTNSKQRALSHNQPKRKTKIHHYDFSRNRLSERPIEKVAIEPYLYSCENIDGSVNHFLDKEVQQVENKAAKAIAELVDISKYALRKKPQLIEIQNSLMDNIMDLLIWQIKRHPDLVNDLKGKCEQFLIEKAAPTHEAKKMALMALKGMGENGKCSIKDELFKKNKVIFCTSTNEAHFITTDKPFVRFNKTGANGIAMPGTEMYYPLTSNMLLFMSGDGNRKEFKLRNDRKLLRELNTFLAKSASRFLFGSSETYLARIVANIKKQEHSTPQPNRRPS